MRNLHYVDGFLQRFVMYPRVGNELKEKKFQLQNSQGHELYVQNQIQPFSLEHHFWY